MAHELLKDPTHAEFIEWCSAWIRILKTLRAENAALINQLADALKETARRSFIEQAEEFQLLMLSREQSMILLRHEINEQMEWLEKQPVGVPAPHLYEVLKGDVEGMVQEHDKVRVAFLVFINQEVS